MRSGLDIGINMGALLVFTAISPSRLSRWYTHGCGVGWNVSCHDGTDMPSGTQMGRRGDVGMGTDSAVVIHRATGVEDHAVSDDNTYVDDHSCTDHHTLSQGYIRSDDCGSMHRSNHQLAAIQQLVKNLRTPTVLTDGHEHSFAVEARDL